MAVSPGRCANLESWTVRSLRGCTLFSVVAFTWQLMRSVVAVAAVMARRTCTFLLGVAVAVSTQEALLPTCLWTTTGLCVNLKSEGMDTGAFRGGQRGYGFSVCWQ